MAIRQLVSLYILVVLFFLIFFTTNISASSAGIFINEYTPNPTGSDTDYEWIELFNSTNEDFNFDGCSLDGITFPDGTIIKSNSYMITTKDLLDADSDGTSFEQYWGNNSKVWGDDDLENYSAVVMNISLKNDNDSVTLSCPQFADTVNWLFSTEGKSYSLKKNSWVDNLPLSPGKSNDVIYLSTLQISEVYPSPKEAETEWIELFNYGDEEISLTGWSIEDNTSRYKFIQNIKVLPKSYYIIDDKVINISLNNSGESLKLENPIGEVLDEFNYLQTDYGVADAKKFETSLYDAEIFKTKVSTPNKLNIIVDPNDFLYDAEVLTIKQAKEKELETQVVVSGTVSAKPGVFGTKLFYIEDNTAGIQVYVSDEEYLIDLEVNDNVKLSGKLKESYDEKKIYISSPSSIVLESGTSEIKLTSLKTGKLNEEIEGSLIFVSGKIVEISGSSFYIDDGSGKSKILIKSSTGINGIKKKKGEYAAVAGILSQYGTTPEGKPSYRVLPRSESDIKISKSPIDVSIFLTQTGEDLNFRLFTSICGMIFYMLFFYRRNKILIFRSKFIDRQGVF